MEHDREPPAQPAADGPEEPRAEPAADGPEEAEAYEPVPMPETGPSVLVLYNQIGEDEYLRFRQIDPATLDFTPEYPIDVATAEEEYRAVVDALRTEGFRAEAMNVEDRLPRLVTTLRHDPPDVIFNLVEFLHGDAKLESNVAAVYELFDVPYTGAGPFALGLCQRKGLTKQLLLENKVRTPRFRVLSSPRFPRRHGLRYPLIVKPAREDASLGLRKDSVVHDLDGLTRLVERMFAEFQPPILVEEFIEGRELHVSVFGNDPPRVLPIIEYDFSNLPDDLPKIISYDTKWNPLAEAFHRVHEVCPAELPARVQRRIEEISLQAYRLTGCRDYARLDIRLTRENRAYVLEVNPNPDLTEGVSFMLAAEKAGLGFEETLRRIVEWALERSPEPGAPPAQPEPTT